MICAGDVAVAQSGSGANREGKAHLCIGTATWVGVSSTTLRNDPDTPFWALNHIDPEKWVIAGEMETGRRRAAVVPQPAGRARRPARPRSGACPPIRSSTSWRPPRRPAATASSSRPGCPANARRCSTTTRRGGFLGLSLGHTRAHLTRSVMEGVAFHIRWIIEAMENVGFSIDADAGDRRRQRRARCGRRSSPTSRRGA